MYDKCKVTGYKALRPGLKLIGAKTKVRNLLYPYFPPHRQYVEPMLGTGGVLIGKPQVELEMVGDLNEYLIDYYHILQQRPEEFWNLLQLEHTCLIKWEKDYFESLKKRITRTDDKLIRAVYFYLITKHCYNGIWRLNLDGECNSSWGKEIKGRGVFTRSRDWYDKVLARIKDVKFHHGPYKGLLAHANWEEKENKFVKAGREASGKSGPPKPEETFVFLDPPYHSCKTVYNGIDWLDEDFVTFKTMLDKAKYRWMVTINKETVEREIDYFVLDLFKDYHIEEFTAYYSCSQTNAGRGPKTELIVMNY